MCHDLNADDPIVEQFIPDKAADAVTVYKGSSPVLTTAVSYGSAMIQRFLSFVSLFLASLKYVAVPSPPPVTRSNVSSVAHITSGSKHVIVQMFEWCA